MTRWVEGEFMKVNAWTFNKSVCSCGRQGWTRMDGCLTLNKCYYAWELVWSVGKKVSP